MNYPKPGKVVLKAWALDLDHRARKGRFAEIFNWVYRAVSPAQLGCTVALFRTRRDAQEHATGFCFGATVRRVKVTIERVY